QPSTVLSVARHAGCLVIPSPGAAAPRPGTGWTTEGGAAAAADGAARLRVAALRAIHLAADTGEPGRHAVGRAAPGAGASLAPLHRHDNDLHRPRGATPMGAAARGARRRDLGQR